MRQRFSVDVQGMDACRAFVDTLCESPRPKIIMDEVVSNIVRCSGATFFEVDYTEDACARTQTLVIRDDGRAFDPLAVEPPDISAAVADRQVGGLGVFMVRKMSKSVDYVRKDGCNVLTIVMAV